MIVAALSFVAGVISIQQFSALPGYPALVFLSALMVIFAWKRFWILAAFIAGLLWAVYFAQTRLMNKLPVSLEGKEIEVAGMIDGVPVNDGKRTKFDFIVRQPALNFPQKIRLSWYFPDHTVKAGQFWQFTVKLKRPYGRFNPGGFDYERWVFSHNIGATGYVRSRHPALLLKNAGMSWGMNQWRQSVSDQLNKVLKNMQHASFIKALTLGDRSAMRQFEWEVFRKTGTVHLIAISGLHIGLVAGLLYVLTLKFWVYFGALSVAPHKLATVSAFSGALAYAALAGFSLPTQRALVMLSVVLLAAFWQRNSGAGKTGMIALLVVIMSDPMAVLSASFWLSFGAVLLIVYAVSSRIGQVGFWNTTVKIHWLTALGLAPVVMFYFQQVSFIAPLANFLAVPVISLVVVPLCLISVVILNFAPVLSEQLFVLVDTILHYLWVFLTRCSEAEFSAISTVQPPLHGVISAVLGVFMLLSPAGVPARYLGLFLCLPLVFVSYEKPAAGEIRLSLLDVGQGLSTVVETQNHILVFDTGAKYSTTYDMGDSVVLPYLRYQGINRIDTLIISHVDNDHIGGAASILAMMSVGNVLSSVPHRLKGFQPEYCVAGMEWRWDGVDFKVLSPPERDFFQTENDNSCVLKVTTKQQSFLLTGDIEQTAERYLVRQYAEALKSGLMIAPHHGSKTSSSLKFLKQVQPEWVLIPAGHLNRFSFPHVPVLQRYSQLEIGWLISSEEGAIVITTNKGDMEIVSSRKKYGRYWSGG